MNYVENARAELREKYPSLKNNPQLEGLYLLLVLVKGEDVTLEDVHDAWAVWRSTTDPQHKDLVPFDQLTAETQELDRKYAERIADAAKELKA